jgi:hypothetical protein
MTQVGSAAAVSTFASVGGGLQIAATQFHQYNHRWILSVRFPF